MRIPQKYIRGHIYDFQETLLENIRFLKKKKKRTAETSKHQLFITDENTSRIYAIQMSCIRLPNTIFRG